MRIGTIDLKVNLRVGEPAARRPGPPAARPLEGALSSPVLAEIAQGLTGGQPLPPDVQAWARALFGADLSRVRVLANDQARRLNEQAGTEGMAVGDRQILLRSPTDEVTLRHEAVHAAQEAAGRPANRQEREAEAVRAEPVLARTAAPSIPPHIDLHLLADAVYDLLAAQLRRERERRL